MTDIDAAITARQFKEAVPQHEADTKRKKDTPRSAVNAYKRKQAAIDKDAENDQENARLAHLYKQELSMSDIGADRTRSETYEYHPYDELYEPVPYWSDETEWGPGLLKERARNAADIATGKGAGDRIYGHNKVQRPPAMTADDFVNGPQGTFAESRTDINARMSAWHDATQHPERAGEFLRGYRIVNDKAIDAVKDSISPNGDGAAPSVTAEDERWQQSWWTPERVADQEKRFTLASTDPNHPSRTGEPIYREMTPERWNEYVTTIKQDRGLIPRDEPKKGFLSKLKGAFNRSEDISPEEYQDMADAAAEEAIDDDEADGRLYRRDTAEERGNAISQHVGDPKDVVADSEAAGRDMPLGWEGHVYGVDFASYLESLMDKGKITPEQYVQARESFNLGRDSRRI